MAYKGSITENEHRTFATAEEVWSGKLHIHNILCPVDFSEFSRRAFQYAAAIAEHFQARLIVQHTVHISPVLFLEGADLTMVRSSLEASRTEANREIRHLIQETGIGTENAIVVVNEGDIRDHIQETISEQNIDLLVMGTHGRKGFNRLMLGSVAEHVVHEAVCPVLVVCRPETEFIQLEEREPVRLKTILAATDFSRNSDRALTHALRWATEWSSRVILFHAVETTPPTMKSMVDLFPEYNPYFERQVAEAWEKIRTQIPEAAQRHCEVTFEVRQGNAREQLLKFAAERKPDLMVMGARGLGRSSLAWGSTISGVVRDGRYPVLAIRHLMD
ncbi:MAG: universal stress protein [Acidobacteria bacterium]|nr:universal stress protein [Acidobacteriota bacterium]